MNKTQKILEFSCSCCSTTFQLLEIHQEGNHRCQEDCWTQWKQLLHSHFQEQIILYLAQKEKENDPDNHD